MSNPESTYQFLWLTACNKTSNQKGHEQKKRKNKSAKTCWKATATCHSLPSSPQQQVRNESSLLAHFLQLPFQFASRSYRSTSKCKSESPRVGCRNEGKSLQNFKRAEIIGFLSGRCPHAAVPPSPRSLSSARDATAVHVVFGVIASRPGPFRRFRAGVWEWENKAGFKKCALFRLIGLQCFFLV